MQIQRRTHKMNKNDFMDFWSKFGEDLWDKHQGQMINNPNMLKEMAEQVFKAGQVSGFKERRNAREVSEAHAKWFCRIVQPLLTSFMEHGIKHGKGDDTLKL